jgi:hypothetical protein
MAPKTKKDRRAEAAERRRKQLDDLKIRNRNRSEDRKIRKLRTVDKRGKVVGQKKKLSTFKAQSSYDIAKQQSGSKTGMSNLGAGYKKAEEKLSKDAAKKSARISKARYPKMGTYKGKDGKSVADEKKKSTSKSKSLSGRIKVGNRLLKRGTPGARQAENRERARKRAQEMAKKRLGK